MHTFEAIKNRRSIREFTRQEITKENLEKLIEAARLAPTARNEQPWEFVVITNQAVKQKISQITDPNGLFISSAAAAIVVFCLNSKYYLEDGSAATENILIQASDLGIGSCWVAGDKKPYCDKVKQLLKVTDKYKLISIIALGYPQQSPGPIEKRAIKDVVHWEAFLTKTLYQKEFKGNNGKSKKSKPKEKNSKKTGESCQKTKNASPKTIKKQKSSKGFFTQG